MQQVALRSNTSQAQAPAAGPANPTCDDGRWIGPGGINVEGRPDSFDAGDRGGVYIWHDSDGWHMRATDISPTDHHYTGSIRLSPGASFTGFQTVRLEKDDRVYVTGDNVLHYSFNTHDGIDGIDFRASACDSGRDNERMRFSLAINGNDEDPGRIFLGDAKQHPDSGTFMVRREVG